jgi:hypothetical protein
MNTFILSLLLNTAPVQPATPPQTVVVTEEKSACAGE